MESLIAIVTLFTLASAQFPQIPGVPGPPWTGPIADHVSGQLVHDTPEVAAAKSQHAQAHSQVLAVLPELPPEIRYQMQGIVIPQNPIPQQQHFVHNPQPVHVHPNVMPQAHQFQEAIHTSPQFTQFAEEIPRSPIGEVPEVHAARVAHLAAHNQVKSVLPVLADNTVHHQQLGFIPTTTFRPVFSQHLQDTPEVAAAKAAHAAAVAAFGK